MCLTGGRMKKIINRRFTGIAIFSVIITTFAMMVIFYSHLKKQVFSDLSITAEILSYDTTDAIYRKFPEDIRVTLIDTDGMVSYDSAADIKELGNHLDRPEVIKVFRTGSGQEARISGTLSENVFYYAMRLENGQVLRVCRKADSIILLFISAIPIVLVMTAVLVAVCMFASHYLAAAILAPVCAMAENMDYTGESGIYEELVPFIKKIRSQHEEILSAANMRQEFTANVTHELKTPLAAISGYAELMETGVAKDADIRHFSHEIGRSASRLLALINDIIKLSKLDAGNYEDMMEIVDLAVIARDTAEILSVNAAKTDVKIKYKGCASAKIRIGKEFAEELAYNLTDNAIRYNRPGGIVEVDVTLHGKTVSFTVSDTGIGIPEEHQERIFERFYRVDKSRSKELGGTGLGLAIVKHICSLTGGRLSLKSKLHQGTSVTITWDNVTG